MTDEQFWWGWWVQFAVAAGTIGAVFVALFGEAVRAKFLPPILSLRLLSREGELCPIGITGPGEDGAPHVRQTEGRFYHLRVVNARRWSPARQVQVFLMTIESPAADGQMQTEFAGSVPLRWRHQEVFPLTRTIGPDADCDLLSVIDKWLQLSTLVAPMNLQARRRDKCHLILTLQARSNEADSLPLRVKVDWDGVWEKGTKEMLRHCVINAIEHAGGPARTG